MDSDFNAFVIFEGLLMTFQRDRALAEKLKSPNIDDDLCVRSAIVGFSYNSPTESWGKGHYDFFRKHALDPSSLGNAEFLFSCECLGYLLGLYEAGKLSDEKFREAEAILPGYILLKAGAI
jgi:hypothetical protein